MQHVFVVRGGVGTSITTLISPVTASGTDHGVLFDAP